MLLLLFQVLKKHHPDFQSKTLTKEKVFKKLFPKKAYNSKGLLNLMSDMNVKIERFWANELLHTDTKLYQKIKIKVFYERDMHEYFGKEAEQLLKELEKVNPKSLSDYKDLLEIYHGVYFHPISNKSKLGLKGIQALIDYSNHYYAYARTLYSLELLNRTTILDEVRQPLQLEEVRTQLLPQLKNPSPDIPFLLTIFELETAPLSLDLYYATYDYFLQQAPLISFETKQIGLFFLLNYLMKHHAKGIPSFPKAMAALFQFGYEQKLLLTKGKLSVNCYFNYINAVTPYDSPENMLQFLKSAAAQLNEKDKPFAIQLARAYFFYLTKDFQATVDILNHLSNIPSYARFQVYSLRLRNSYELALLDDTCFPLFFRNCKNFTQFLKRNTMPTKKNVEGYLNFVFFFRKLGWYQFKGVLTEDFRTELLDEIAAVELVYLKHWLVQKVAVVREHDGSLL